MHRTAMASSAVALAVALALLPGQAQTVGLYPGARMTAPQGCTLAFVLTDGTDLFMATAGHCTHAVGDRVAAEGVGPFGTVVLRRNATDDLALIRIDPTYRGAVSPMIPGLGAPTGIAHPGQTRLGDQVGLSGHGIGVGALEATRTRPGVLVGQDDRHFSADAPALFGDSGGPVIHVPSGLAIGMIEGIAATSPPSTVYGSTMDRLIALAAADGLLLSLVTG